MCNLLQGVFFKLVVSSKNVKTGNLTQVYTSSNTCPISCPFKNKGCYGKNYHTIRVWKNCNLTIEELKQKIKSNALTSIIRHNVTGDISIQNTNIINSVLVSELIKAYKGYKAYTYTHCNIFNWFNVMTIKNAIKQGFIINASCENLLQVKQAKQNNIPCVMTVNKMNKNILNFNNMLFVKCPNQVINEKNKQRKKDNLPLLPVVTCASCKACSNPNRKAIIVFKNHGQFKKYNDFLINL